MSPANGTGIVHGHTVLLDDTNAPLADGTRVLVTALPPQGSPAALLAAIQAEPHLTAADVAELEAILEAATSRPSHVPSFWLHAIKISAGCQGWR